MARVRFAPSPTGRFHIGGARTALYNVLLARQTGGQFILRIEDTDTKRSTPEALEELKTALRWLGLQWDEGPDVGGPHAPYNQLARKAIYQRYAQQLLDAGHAYRCFCSPQRLAHVRESQQKLKQPPRYDGHCRHLSPAESQARAEAGEPFTIRFRTPKEGSITVRDYLRGDITVMNKEIDDYIIVKSDGLALYHLAAMVDDHEMGITHVFRGQEWLGTFPLHAHIIRALGWQEPVWCHLSVFLKPSGKGKLSKRDVSNEQSVFVLELRDLGYLPEAVNAWTALMGASFGADEAVMTLEEMVARFSLDHLNPAPARVNFDKLDHFNGLFIRRLTLDDLTTRLLTFFHAAGYPQATFETLRPITPLLQERMTTLTDGPELAGFFFCETVTPHRADLLPKGLTPAQALEILHHGTALMANASAFTHEALEQPVRRLAEELGLKAGLVFSVLRVAVTGQAVSPPLFESMEIVGREKTLARLAQAAQIVQADG